MSTGQHSCQWLLASALLSQKYRILNHPSLKGRGDSGIGFVADFRIVLVNFMLPWTRDQFEDAARRERTETRNPCADTNFNTDVVHTY